MTYIIANPSIALQKKQLEELLKKIFKKKIAESPDIHVLNPKEQNSIGIEEVKDLQGSMRYKPFQEERQVGIILEAEKLTIQAQNALLKTLEETSDTSIYILCVDNERNLLPTIQSRGVIIYPRLQGIEEEESPEEGEESLADILDLDLLEQFSLIEEYAKEKESSLLLLNALEERFKRELELDIKNGNIESSHKNGSLLKIIQKSREKISANCNRRLTLEAMIVQLKA